jgi:hypothetical protein
MYSEAGNPTSVEIMFPGNYGIGKAIAAEVNRRKKAKKIANAFMFLPPFIHHLRFRLCWLSTLTVSNRLSTLLEF